MALVIDDCRILAAGAGAPPASVRVAEGRIARIGPAGAREPGDRVLDAGGRLLIPGLVDLHLHGAGGVDLLDGDPDGLETLARALARMGTTAFLGTTFLWPETGSRHLAVAAERVGRETGGARMLGLYLEGPFIEPARRGGLPPQAVLPPSADALERVLDLCAGTLRVMTLAPELPGALPLVERLAERGVLPAFGHSAAGYAQTRDGIAAGIRHVTHLYNAMRGLHHRDPGPLPAIHEAAGVTVELIADGVHVDPAVVRWTERILPPERLLCVTDSMRTAGLPDGRYRYGGRDFESRDGAARYPDGTLIGTSLGLLEVVRRFHRDAGVPLARAVDAATRVPAAVLGANKGAVEEGRDADLVVLDADLAPWVTIVGGEVVHGAAP